jgi:hypothetical protein
MSTHNVTGNHLNDTSLNLPNPLSPPETINVRGVTEMNILMGTGDSLTVNLKAHSEWIGGFTSGIGNKVSVNGAGTFANKASFVNGTAIIGVNVVGAGTFTATEAHSSGKLEFMHSVSAGQTVDVQASGYFLQHGTVQIDDPSAYHAQTNLGYGEVILEGLKATSYSLKNDLLTLFKGHAVVDTMRLAVVHIGALAPTSFGISQVGSAIDIHSDGGLFSGGTALAHHA